MARHSDGKNNYAFAPWVIVVAILALLALIVGGFFLFRGGDSDSADMAATEASAESTAAAGSGSESTAHATTPASESSTEATSSEKAGESEAEESESESSSAAPSSEDKSADPVAEVAPNTLFLLDTSDNLAPYFDAVSQGVADAATAAGDEGSQVGLWNYSSPISATATVGYRPNVAYGEADNVAQAVGLFGTGGVPQTRSAVVAALGNASDQVAESGKDTRVVLITTGTQQDMDDAAFTEAVKNARGEGVSLSVVHLGKGEKDAELEKLADSYSTVSDPSDATVNKKSITAAAGAQ
ncbi:vWA domain-containing protein [Corynebacterium minutissimum]